MCMKVDVHIYGVHARDHMISTTVKKLGLDDNCVYYDDRPDGGLVLYTAKKAWLAPIPEGITHRIALADDAYVCDGFLDIAQRIAEAHPDDIISFFPHEFMQRNPDIEGMDTPYFKAHFLFGAAIMMPVKYRTPCFRYIEERFHDEIADDDGIYMWAQTTGVRILTTIPAIVQHIGDDSILDPGRAIRRTVYFDEHPVADWDSRKVMEYRQQEWFFSNHGKPRKTKGVLTVVSGT